MTLHEPLVVLDDDPTGTQAMADVPVLLDLGEAAMRQVAASHPKAVHLMTNSRAVDADAARSLVGGVARVANQVWPSSEMILRGDSTLRGHVHAEYEAIREVRFPNRWPVLLLAPGLPAAGRITVGGVHLLERDGRRTPLHDTEYARDPAFAYGSSRLLLWAQERSAGTFEAARGTEVHLEELRRDGAPAVEHALARLAGSGQPTVCAVDAEDEDDLRTLLEGFFAARSQDVPVILRCAPTAAGLASGATADRLVELPAVGGPIVVVCGSFVPTSSRQLAALEQRHPAAMVVADVDRLVMADAEHEVSRLVGEVDRRVTEAGVAVLTTPRVGPQGPGGLDLQEQVAAAIASAVRRLPSPPGAVVTKGGVTSAVTIQHGLGAPSAWVVGPAATGVGCWRVSTDRGGETWCLVVPGNVGDDRLLVELVDGLLERQVMRG
jgi:uncharacterized protein YgbK (DUF1537 family)